MNLKKYSVATPQIFLWAGTQSPILRRNSLWMAPYDNNKTNLQAQAARSCAQPKNIWPHCDVAGWFSCAFSMVGWIFRPAENVMLLTVFTHHAIEVFFFQMKFAKKQVAKKIKVRK